jgi:hypothetical protein
MKPSSPPQVLFYPFHLCHKDTLAKLLLRFATVHFRDFMALQLTPMVGMTAYVDRMGDSFPDLLASGRLIQGYDVSSPLSPEVVAAIDRDLRDPAWRQLFERSLLTNRRFEQGLFGARYSFPATMTPWDTLPFSVGQIKERCAQLTSDEVNLEYGLALVKTAASLVYTYRLALTHGLQVATDSPAHFELFEESRKRENLSLANHLIVRKGY